MTSVDADRVADRRVGPRPGVADTNALHDRFAGLRRAGIDEISHQRGHRYLTVVIDHDSGRLVWAAPGHDKATRKTQGDPENLLLTFWGRNAAPRSPTCQQRGLGRRPADPPPRPATERAHGITRARYALWKRAGC